ALRRAVRINSIDSLCLTKLDVLDGIEELKIGVGYRYRGQETDHAPLDVGGWSECEPIYRSFPGWSERTAGVRRYEDLPQAARNYLEAISELVECPLSLISTSPDRDDNIVLRDPFA
ncbi:MAG: adenylosuccinate synthetase, partial [Xanthomonadales bacterium]|nr:adenylosuccinate synthetase [Xanthomonadales bacterium]